MYKQKKFYGNKNWSETLYFYSLDDIDIEWKKENLENVDNIKIGDNEFYLIPPPFGEDDKNSCNYFSAFFSGMDDTNLFITDTEEYNWYKRNRI